MTRFYDIDQANARLLDLAPLLRKLKADRDALATAQRTMASYRQTNGNAHHADELTAQEGRIGEMVLRMERLVAQIVDWDVTLRDIETGLVDFPALVNGRQVCLCWRLGEDDIAWWHELDAGFGGRKPLIELT